MVKLLWAIFPCVCDASKSIKETNRRRAIQEAYNEEHGIIPKTIVKPIVMPLHVKDNAYDFNKGNAKLTRKEKEIRIKEVEKEMREAARQLDFERAATLRDILFELKGE